MRILERVLAALGWIFEALGRSAALDDEFGLDTYWRIERTLPRGRNDENTRDAA